MCTPCKDWHRGPFSFWNPNAVLRHADRLEGSTETKCCRSVGALELPLTAALANSWWVRRRRSPLEELWDC